MAGEAPHEAPGKGLTAAKMMHDGLHASVDRLRLRRGRCPRSEQLKGQGGAGPGGFDPMTHEHESSPHLLLVTSHIRHAAAAAAGLILALSDPTCQVLGVSCTFGNVVG